MKKIAILSVCLSWFACGKIWAQPDVAIFADNAFSIEIMNGDNTPDPSDFTDFGTMSLGGPDSTHLFTIASWGSEDIDVTIVSATSGTYFTAEFDSPPPPPGFFLPWTFIVTFQASSAPIGVYNAIITIESNDPDENPFTFAVRAEVTGAPPPIFPEINVQGNGMDITDGDPLPSTADGTDFGSITFGDAPVIHTFTIQNIGDDLLNVTDISLAGAGASAYSLGALDPASPVAPFEYATFTVAFDPATAGTFSATLNIANDDPDENPYNFAITGTATTPPPPPAADLEARGNNVVILNGDTSPSTVDGTDFGTNPASLMFPLNHAFMMKNIGATTIHLDTITLTGSGAAAYLLPSNPTFPDTLSPGDSTSFWVSFQPSSNGTFNATVNIANDDPNENPYTFDVTGVSAAIPGREISVSGNGVEISNNDTSPTLLDGTDFGEINQGSGASNLFYIYNLGQTILNVGSISISGANAGDFTASDLFVDPFLPPGEVPPGAGGFFSIDFNPTAVGLRQAIVTISNDDPDENPYVFYVQGTGMAALTTWYQDADGDGFGNAVVSQIAGSQPMGYVANDDDCDDSDFNVNPTATETCNGVDDNCDSQIDEGLGSTWYADSDGDSYGDPLVSQVSCSQPTGYVADNTDCDDADFNINPLATEVCNGVDDNCDGNIDEGLGTTWYADADGDSYGDPLVSQVSCSQPT
ncbi:MAG: choice-of-anchor D domain-containing protein, partial [Bacteroidetes bacterium]|nr:choice-of-anchor D domain-containing protein [Bacteroidota bacterium]